MTTPESEDESFVSLSTSAIGLPGKNRIDKNDLRARTVGPIHLKKNSVRGFQVKPNSLGGFFIKENTLGPVPNATDANIRGEYSSGPDINVEGTTGNQTVRTVVINAPVAGKLLINGGLRIDATVEDQFGCDFLLNGSLLGASSRTAHSSNATAAADHGCETSDGADVSAGPHTVELRGIGVEVGNEIEDASLQVLFVPNL